jgi:BirA family biotin operon repressor/biotin-[acetyl-CoA-carboxylase] ligase
MLSVNLVQADLTTLRLGREIAYFPFQVVVTDDQRLGKGRHERQWFSAPGLGLTFSVLLQPHLPSERLGLISLAAGVAVVDALAKEKVDAQLKWPNDVLVNRLKLGGILSESRVTEKGLIVVLGIGLNVNEQAGDFPEDLRANVMSVRMALGRSVQREILLAETLACLEMLLDEGMDDITTLWLDRCAHLEQEGTFHGPDGLVEGRFLGVNEAGLGLLKVGGKTQIIAAGDLVYESDTIIDHK